MSKWWACKGKAPAKLRKVSVGLPLSMGTAEWEADESEVRAAWSLYVELVTRISVQPFGDQDGLMREALTSLHSLFGETRLILRAAGPSVGAHRRSVGGLAIEVLNKGLRPFLTKWHPGLQAWESRRESGVSPLDHEMKFSDRADLLEELGALQGELETYAVALAEIAGVETGE